MRNYKSKDTLASLKKDQLLYNESAKATKQLPVLSIPSIVIPDATAATFVGKGNLCRIEGQASQYVAFGASGMSAPNSSSQDAIECPSDFFLVIATDEYIRTSAAMRIEVTED